MVIQSVSVAAFPIEQDPLALVHILLVTMQSFSVNEVVSEHKPLRGVHILFISVHFVLDNKVISVQVPQYIFPNIVFGNVSSIVGSKCLSLHSLLLTELIARILNLYQVALFNPVAPFSHG